MMNVHGHDDPGIVWVHALTIFQKTTGLLKLFVLAKKINTMKGWWSSTSLLQWNYEKISINIPNRCPAHGTNKAYVHYALSGKTPRFEG